MTGPDAGRLPGISSPGAGWAVEASWDAGLIGSGAGLLTRESRGSAASCSSGRGLAERADDSGSLLDRVDALPADVTDDEADAPVGVEPVVEVPADERVLRRGHVPGADRDRPDARRYERQHGALGHIGDARDPEELPLAPGPDGGEDDSRGGNQGHVADADPRLSGAPGAVPLERHRGEGDRDHPEPGRGCRGHGSGGDERGHAVQDSGNEGRFCDLVDDEDGCQPQARKACAEQLPPTIAGERHPPSLLRSTSKDLTARGPVLADEADTSAWAGGPGAGTPPSPAPFWCAADPRMGATAAGLPASSSWSMRVGVARGLSACRTDPGRS
jgi:hypothetical protein